MAEFIDVVIYINADLTFAHVVFEDEHGNEITGIKELPEEPLIERYRIQSSTIENL